MSERARLTISDEREFTIKGIWTDDHYFPRTMLVGGEPVAIINPDDREQVERFLTALRSTAFKHGVGYVNLSQMFADEQHAVLAAALREFANPTPPKPEEPTGLGAVVEDADGLRYVRTAWLAAPWCGSDHSMLWQHIDVVRVLSEGVPPGSSEAKP